MYDTWHQYNVASLCRRFVTTKLVRSTNKNGKLPQILQCSNCALACRPNSPVAILWMGAPPPPPPPLPAPAPAAATRKSQEYTTAAAATGRDGPVGFPTWRRRDTLRRWYNNSSAPRRNIRHFFFFSCFALEKVLLPSQKTIPL